jgi:lamin tail-like protein
MRRLCLFLCALALLVVPAAQGTSTPTLVVSQVYGGGGNSGATYANDFVELLNAGSSAVDLSSWSLQYAAASSTSWSPTSLSGTLQPGRYFLVALASSGSVGAALPGADASGTTNLAVSGGKVAIVHDTAALTCGASAGSCSAVSTVADLVGYGSATDFEGAAAPTGSATLAVARGGAGCADTNHNDADFDTAAPAPRTTASAAASCASGSGSSSQGAAVDVDVQPVLSLTLQRAALSFGSAAAGDTPAALGDQLTVVSNSATGYALSVHRTAFAPSDLPLAIGTTAPTGGTLGAGVTGSAAARIPVPPAADLLLGTTATRSAASGDVWPASIGFASPLPAVPPGHYTVTVTFTVVGR